MTATEKKKSTTVTAKAGLVFPVNRVNKFLVKSTVNKSVRVGANSPIYLAGVLEYLFQELIQSAADNVVASGKKRILARDVIRAYQNDEAFSQLLASHKVLVGPPVRRVAKDFETKSDRVFAEFKKNAATEAAASIAAA